MSDEVQSCVRTKELVLVDGEGRDRARLGVDENGSVSLKFVDGDAKTRTRIGVTESGQAQIELGKGEGKPNLTIMVDHDGRVMMEGIDNDGIERFRLELKGNGSHTELSFHERHRKPRMVIISEDKGPAGLFILDHDGKALFSTSP